MKTEKAQIFHGRRKKISSLYAENAKEGEKKPCGGLPKFPEIGNILDQVVDKMHDQRRREKKLMVFGLPEMGAPHGDCDVVVKLLHEIGADEGFVSCQRLGQARGDSTAVLLILG